MAFSRFHQNKTICPICSLQDGLILEWSEPAALFTDKSLLAIDYDVHNPINEGSLCPRGNSVAELVDHPQRLTSPRVDGQNVGWSQALARVAADLKNVTRKHGPEAVAVLAGGSLSLDEAATLGKLARELLRTPQVAPLFPDDGAVFSRMAHLGWDEGFSLKDLQERQAMFLIGDVFAEHPVISKRILRAKYKNRPHRLFVLDAVPTKTTWFAHQHLRPTPGTEALVLAGITQLVSVSKKKNTPIPLNLDLAAVEKRTGVTQQQMETVAAALSSARDGAIVQSSLFGRQGHPGICALLGYALARLLPGQFNFLHLPVFWNGRGVYQMMSLPGEKAVTGPQIVESLVEGHIKGLLLFGTDPLSAVPSEKLQQALENLDLLCAVEPLPTLTTPLAHVILPAAIGPEKKGRVLYLNGEENIFEQAVPAPGLAKSEGDILLELAKQLSQKGTFPISPDASTKRMKGMETTPWVDLMKADRPTLDRMLSAQKDSKSDYRLHLVPAAVAAHLGDGSLSRHFSWAKRVCEQPCIWASPDLMAELNLKEGDRVKVTSQSGEAMMPIKIDKDLPAGVVTAPVHFPEVRRLFSASVESITGELDPGPERVSLSLSKERHSID